MDESETVGRTNKIVPLVIVLAAVFLLVGVGFLLLGKGKIVSPLPEGEVRVVFVSPQTESVASPSAALVSTPSATPKSTSTSKASPAASATPKTSPASVASPSATPS